MVRLPLAGPYRPAARLFVRSDGAFEWTVRLWEIDRPVPRTVETATLLAFARLNGLGELVRDIEELVARATRRGCP